MTETTPPSGPSEVPPQPPPIEVQAEPARPDDRGRVFDAPAGGATGGASTGPSSAAAPRNGGWAAFCHLVGLIDFGFSFLFLGLIATLVLWLIRKDVDPEADYHGKEAINFQLNVLFWQLAAVPLVLCCLIGIPLMIALPVAKVVLMIMAAVQAANGERWRYPLIFRVLR